MGSGSDADDTTISEIFNVTNNGLVIILLYLFHFSYGNDYKCTLVLYLNMGLTNGYSMYI